MSTALWTLGIGELLEALFDRSGQHRLKINVEMLDESFLDDSHLVVVQAAHGPGKQRGGMHSDECVEVIAVSLWRPRARSRPRQRR